MSRPPRAPRALLPLLLCGCASCGDAPGEPRAGRASLSFTPLLPVSEAELARFGLAIDNIRLVVVRSPSDTALDQAFALAPDQATLALRADIPLRQSPETVLVALAYRTGSIVLFSGTGTFQLSDGVAAQPRSFPVTYTGPGQNVALLSLSPQNALLTFGATVQYTATAFDVQGAPVPDFYVGWSTADTTIAAIDALGRLTAPSGRATLDVIARTPNGVSAATLVTFQPAATTLALLSGDGQSGIAGTILQQPLVARVRAADGLGVRGVEVSFAVVAGGGVLTAARDTTDANGDASVLWTLGLAVGVLHRVQATVPGLAGSPVTFVATPLPGTTR